MQQGTFECAVRVFLPLPLDTSTRLSQRVPEVDVGFHLARFCGRNDNVTASAEVLQRFCVSFRCLALFFLFFFVLEARLGRSKGGTGRLGVWFGELLYRCVCVL